ncbi:MAG: polyprenyl synthetase family protein [Ruminococcaceae bacterium]|nr:polyprenyl synthetase family protein [Oscillospiraceae bacterium]MBR3597476.1 polyprenyl synthetase family protein [Clostridia bacterium]
MSNIALYVEKIENALKNTLPELSEETAAIGDMLRYSLEGGGKRIRPLLCLEFCAAAGGNVDNALLFACAVEFVHTYSLVHDDLPCMDNDDYRRGKLSSHKMFGEANALLAGDALLTEAFNLLSRAAFEGHVSSEQAVRAVRELSLLSGMKGMIGGQYIDLKYENTPANLPVLIEMDTLKTAALIECACALGLIAAGADDMEISYARDFARELGIAFQIEDDVLEASESGESSDVKNGKVTYVSLFGVEKAKELAAIHTKNALSALERFGPAADEIRMIAENLLNRKN